MEQHAMQLIQWLGQSGALAPILFIFLHILRQFLFIPVGFICILGGVVFGAVFGTIYSLIGITLVSLYFYFLVKSIPKSYSRFMSLKERWFGKRSALSVGQITILRLVPFLHFHLISLCLIEITRNFKEYTKVSLFTNVPLALVYTSLGNWLNQLTVNWMISILFILAVLFYTLRKKEWVYKWQDFFAEAR
ncbi:TVP38/TMEM64 family protein [Pseudalkalibacillus berkeleyi]|uniref:TVP38/TMEM64 family membrane protein n=1 Tax=Pseudalkalibacillus berkeleyi TaxID=1069813 RepID=A0ABS9GZK7_9BACL|nr:VTT domain-containing protein [Pseudalkalibacillus berkeleyi]MCF6138177.1 VTT domain-containing protein [Pseudalkalibacillus berkeleyi]